MLITCKTITQETFQVDVDPSDTIKVVKEKIQSGQGAKFPAEHLKLVYSGKILNDDQKVSDAKIDEKKFVVVMVTQKKSPAVSSSVPQASAPRPQPSPPRTTQVKAPPASSPKEEGKSVERAPGAKSVTGAEYERCVAEIVSMGYSREQVEAAMQASNNDPDQAVDFLLSSIPEKPTGKQAVVKTPVPVQVPEGDEEENADGEDPLEFLRRSPAWANMRRVMRENPNELPKLLERIERTNPRLHAVIIENQERFVQMLTEPEGENRQQAAAGGGQGLTSSAGQGGIATKQMAPAEREAIERLKAMGFPEPMVEEAYFACDKNENLAVNFLLQQMDDNAKN